MKTKNLCLCLAFICMFTLSSCFPVHRFSIFNNSGVTVEIQSEYNVTRTIENGHNVTFDDPFNLQISNLTRQENWMYCIGLTNYPSCEKYCQTGLFSLHKIRIQLESTGEIYLLLPSEKFPLKDFRSQPQGFPLKPIIQP